MSYDLFNVRNSYLKAVAALTKAIYNTISK